METKDDEDYYYDDKRYQSRSKNSRSSGRSHSSHKHRSSSRKKQSDRHSSHKSRDKHEHRSRSKNKRYTDKSHSSSSNSHSHSHGHGHSHRDRRRQHEPSPSLLDSNTQYITKEVAKMINNERKDKDDNDSSGNNNNSNNKSSSNSNNNSNNNNNNNNSSNSNDENNSNTKNRSTGSSNSKRLSLQSQTDSIVSELQKLSLSPMQSFSSNVGGNAPSNKHRKSLTRSNDINLENFEFGDPLESHKRLILQTIHSQRLAWYYNDWLKTWDVVYKIEPSEQNENFWIVTDSHQNYYAMHKNNLYPIAPSDEMSVKQVVTILLDALNQKFLETAVRILYVFCVFFFFLVFSFFIFFILG